MVFIFGDCIMRCVITLLSMSVISVSILKIYVTQLSISKFKFTKNLSFLTKYSNAWSGKIYLVTKFL